MRTVRYENKGRKEYNEVQEFCFFYGPEVVKNFTPFLCIEFHSISEPPIEKS